MTWKPGDVALCINNRPGPGSQRKHPLHPLREGSEYLVMSVMHSSYEAVGLFGISRGQIILKLAGAPNPYAVSGSWHEARFRKVEPKITTEQVRQEELDYSHSYTESDGG